MCIVMEEQIAWCDSVAHYCILNFLDNNTSSTSQMNIRLVLHQFIDGFSHFKKKI